MAFTEAEKVSIRHHTGYLNVQAASTFVLGIPAGVQTTFMIEGAMNKVLAHAEPRARKLLATLETIEAQIVDNLENLEALQVDEIQLNPKAFEKLVQRYDYFCNALCNLLGVTRNPFDQRKNQWGTGGGGGVNISVQH